jgi:hypothetical protein
MIIKVLRLSGLEVKVWLQLSGLDHVDYWGGSVVTNVAVSIFRVNDFGTEPWMHCGRFFNRLVLSKCWAPFWLMTRLRSTGYIFCSSPFRLMKWGGGDQKCPDRATLLTEHFQSPLFISHTTEALPRSTKHVVLSYWLAPCFSIHPFMALPDRV